MINFQFFHILFQVLNCRHHTHIFHEPWELDLQQFLPNALLPVVWDSEKVMEYHGTVHGVTGVNVHQLLQSSALVPVNKPIHECPNLLFICNTLAASLCHGQHTGSFQNLAHSPPRNSLRHNSGLKNVSHLYKTFSEQKI